MTDLAAAAFEEHRSHLRSVAYHARLGDQADDAVQDAWLKLTRADTSAVENLRAGDMEALVAVLDPEVVAHVDGGASPPDALAELVIEDLP